MLIALFFLSLRRPLRCSRGWNRCDPVALKGQLRGRVSTCLAEDLQFASVFVVGGQSGELLQQERAGRGGDVQEVLEGLVDGAGGDASLIGPVAYHA